MILMPNFIVLYEMIRAGVNKEWTQKSRALRVPASLVGELSWPLKIMPLPT